MGGEIKLLLDTPALLWWLTDDPKLSGAAATLIAATGNQVVVSPICAVEIAIKHRRGRLPLGDVLVPAFRNIIEAEGFEFRSITTEHALRAGSYPAAHRDPFDRLLAAQAELDGRILLTRDPEFSQFPCETLW